MLALCFDVFAVLEIPLDSAGVILNQLPHLPEGIGIGGLAHPPAGIFPFTLGDQAAGIGGGVLGKQGDQVPAVPGFQPDAIGLAKGNSGWVIAILPGGFQALEELGDSLCVLRGQGDLAQPLAFACILFITGGIDQIILSVLRRGDAPVLLPPAVRCPDGRNFLCPGSYNRPGCCCPVRQRSMGVETIRQSPLTAYGGLSPLCTRGAFLCPGSYNRPWLCCPARERSLGPASRWAAQYASGGTPPCRKAGNMVCWGE